MLRTFETSTSPDVCAHAVAATSSLAVLPVALRMTTGRSLIRERAGDARRAAQVYGPSK